MNSDRDDVKSKLVRLEKKNNFVHYNFFIRVDLNAFCILCLIQTRIWPNGLMLFGSYFRSGGRIPPPMKINSTAKLFVSTRRTTFMLSVFAFEVTLNVSHCNPKTTSNTYVALSRKVPRNYRH